jgi:hypothetical protein
MDARELAEGERVKEERRPSEPAPLPLHALLLLQQGAGNLAVGRLLARQKVNDQRRNGFLKAATTGKTGAKTAADTLKAMCNAYGATLKPAQGPWADGDTAITALLALNPVKFDAEDEAAFRKAADDKFPTAGANAGQAAAANTQRLVQEIREDRPAVEDEFAGHIFDGVWKTDGEPGGYHSINGPSATHEAFGEATPIGNGVYQRSVRARDDHTNVKKSQSTFFPDAADKDDVLNGVTTVYGRRGRERGLTTMQYPDRLKGIRLQQIDGTTIFPAGGGPLRGEGWMSAEEKKKAKRNKS